MYRTPRQQSGRHGLKIRLLGGFRIEVSAQVVADSDWRLQKARALVKLLALAPRHRLTRDEAMERLWPELEPAAALNNLYYALHVARAALEGGVPVKSGGSSALQLAGGVITFSPSGSVCIDIETFQTAATAAWQSKDPIAYSKALNLYAGELLPEDRYEDWAARPREMLRDIQLRLLMDLAQIRQERGEYPEAIASLTQLMTEEPTHEEACASLMFLHAAAGQRWNALRAFAQLRTALREELDVEPSAATQHLHADILAGALAATTAGAHAASNLTTPGITSIGRKRELGHGHSSAPRVAWSS